MPAKKREKQFLQLMNHCSGILHKVSLLYTENEEEKADLLMVTAVPAAILWTGWSQRKAYGEEIRELREMIAMLSAPD